MFVFMIKACKEHHDSETHNLLRHSRVFQLVFCILRGIFGAVYVAESVSRVKNPDGAILC